MIDEVGASRLTIGRLLSAVRHRWIAVVAGVVVGLAVSGAFVLAATPRYEASTEVFVTADATADPSLLLDSSTFIQDRVLSYTRVATSPRVLAAVIAELRLDTTPEDLAERVSATSPLDTVLIDITATDSDPARAAQIADAVTSQFVAVVGVLERPATGGAAPVTLSSLQTASVPTRPVSPRTTLDLLVGLLGGLLIGVAAAVLMELGDRRIRDGKDIPAVSGLPVIGRVTGDVFPAGPPSAAMHAHGRQAAEGTAPGPGAGAEAIRQLRANIQFRTAESGRPPTVLVASAGSGEGRTSVAVDLATALAAGGDSVALVDADLRRPRIAGSLGLAGAAGLSSVLTGESDVGPALHDLGGGLHVLASGPRRQNPADLLGSPRMSRVLAELARSHDYVVVDSSPVLSFADGTVLARHLGGVLLVAATGRSRDDLARAADALARAGGHVLGVVLTSAPPRARRGGGSGVTRAVHAGAGTPPEAGARGASVSEPDSVGVPGYLDVDPTSGSVGAPALRDPAAPRPDSVSPLPDSVSPDPDSVSPDPERGAVGRLLRVGLGRRG